MKVTVSINLGGYAFNIDEDAYEALQEYIRSLEREFEGEESAREIISDIESRLAELFRQKLNNYKQVITIDDVRAAEEVLGTPEAISGNEEAEKIPHASRRIYRDPDNRLLGGVSAGLAAWFNINMWLLRFLFILFQYM